MLQTHMKHKSTVSFRVLLVCMALLALCLLAGCAGGAPSAASSLPESAQSTSEPEAQPTPAQPTPVGGTLPQEGTNALTGKQGGDYHRRPIAVMLYNTEKAFPQWGISDVEILFEALTEGTDTWAMALVASNKTIEKIGPVAPARDLFLQFAMPYASALAFIGTDAYAANLLNAYGYQPLDGKYIGTITYDLDYARDATAPQELCWHTNGEMIKQGLNAYGQSSTIDTPLFFNFQNDSAPANTDGQELRIRYSETSVAKLVYTQDGYKLYRNGESQKDGNNDEARIFFDNVLLLMARSGRKDDGVTRDYDLTSGEGLYLSGGGAMVIQWQKGDAQSALRLFDADGNELSVQPGSSYIGVWGGFEGQTLHLIAASGEEQPVPAVPQEMQVAE